MWASEQEVFELQPPLSTLLKYLHWVQILIFFPSTWQEGSGGTHFLWKLVDSKEAQVSVGSLPAPG